MSKIIEQSSGRRISPGHLDRSPFSNRGLPKMIKDFRDLKGSIAGRIMQNLPLDRQALIEILILDISGTLDQKGWRSNFKFSSADSTELRARLQLLIKAQSDYAGLTGQQKLELGEVLIATIPNLVRPQYYLNAVESTKKLLE